MQHAVETIEKYREVLESLNIATIEVRYEGSGDSGEIYYTGYLDKEGNEIWSGWAHDKGNIFSQTEVKDACLQCFRCTKEGLLPIWRDGSVQDLVESIALLALPGGWEINEGSTGSLWIDLSGEGPLIRIDHSWYVMTTEDYVFTSEGVTKDEAT